jgi:gas vesicle protein
MVENEEVIQMDTNHRNGNFGAFLLGTIVGGLIATTTTLLFAPQSGEQTQQQIKDRAIALRTEAEGKIEQGRQSAGDAVKRARSSVADWLEQGAKVIDKRAEDIRAED